jgi:hypothetical protein
MTNTPTTPARSTGSPRPVDANTADQAGAEARNVAETGRQKANEVADEAQNQAAELARTARDQAKQRADGEVGRLAGFLGEIGDELDGMASRSDSSDGYLPGLARDGAHAANRLSHRLETGGLDGALHDVEQFARRRPGMFLAAAFGVGLAIGRVTRNADVRSISDEMDSTKGSDRDTGRSQLQPSSAAARSASPTPMAEAASPASTTRSEDRLR